MFGWVWPDAAKNKNTIFEVFHEEYLLLNFNERVEQLMASWQFSLFLRPPTARSGLNLTTEEREKNTFPRLMCQDFCFCLVQYNLTFTT